MGGQLRAPSDWPPIRRVGSWWMLEPDRVAVFENTAPVKRINAVRLPFCSGSQMSPTGVTFNLRAAYSNNYVRGNFHIELYVFVNYACFVLI
jgi:hypothetical protein